MTRMSSKLKPGLMAELNAARARVYRALIGLDEHALTTRPVVADWTARDLLVHLGDYDRLYARAIRLALAGRLEAHGLRYEPVQNATLRARSGDLDLTQALGYARRSRAAFVTALDQVPQRRLQREYVYPWREGTRRSSVAQWTRWRAQHDAEHCADLLSWRPEQPLSGSTGPKAILAAALDAARDDLHATLALLAPSDRATKHVVGRWTARDLAGHLADWDTLFIHWFKSMLGRRSTTPYFDDDGDAMNAHLATGRLRQGWARVYGDLRAQRAAFQRLVARTSETELLRPRPGGDFPTAYHCAWSALEHYLHHAADVRAGLRLKMPEWLLAFEGPYT